MAAAGQGEGLRAGRLLLVLSSVSPLFILWGVRGTALLSDAVFAAICAITVIVPNAFLWLRIRTAKKLREQREITVGDAEDNREHLLVYLFAMLLPVYAVDLATWRDLGAALMALAFIIFLFWHLNLHYMNLVFAVFGYRVFTIYPPTDENPLTGRDSLMLVTRRVSVPSGIRVTAYRVSDTVLLETN